MDSQANANTNLNAESIVTTQSLINLGIGNPSLDFYVTSSGGIVQSSFNYFGEYTTGYVTISGSALNATEYYSVSLSQGSNSNVWSVTAIKTGSINATITIGGNKYSLGTVYVYAISSGGANVTPMPPTVHLTAVYKTTINAGDPGTLHFIFTWPAQHNNAYPDKQLFAALKVGEYVSLNTMHNESSFQEFWVPVVSGKMEMTYAIPVNIDTRYMQIAFTTDYINLHTYFDQQHAFTNFNQPSDPFLVTGLQSTNPVFYNNSPDFNVLKVINGVISKY